MGSPPVWGVGSTGVGSPPGLGVRRLRQGLRGERVGPHWGGRGLGGCGWDLMGSGQGLTKEVGFHWRGWGLGGYWQSLSRWVGPGSEQGLKRGGGASECRSGMNGYMGPQGL